MDAKTFLANFGVIADAPNGVAKLRELVLQLAVQGKLVEQDSKDEPAAKLLLRLAKAKLQEAENENDEDLEERFRLPTPWRWATLRAISQYIQRGKGPSYVEKSSVPVVSQKCIQWSGFSIALARFIDEESLPQYGAERFLQPGDLLWNSTGTGTLGRVGVYPDVRREWPKVVTDSHVTVIRLLEVSPRFVWCWLASPFVQDEMETVSTGTTKQKELGTGTVRAYPVPVPPLPEQHRIVAKVDELMKLCDDLEARQQRRHVVRKSMQVSVLQALTEAESPEELKRAWERAKGNWDVVAGDTDGMPALRQSMMQLAVTGRLVRQEQKEESGQLLLKRLGAHHSPTGPEKGEDQSVVKGRGMGEADRFLLPSAWTWAATQQLYEVVGGIQKTPTRRPEANAYPYLRVANVQRGRLDLSEVAQFELQEGELQRWRLQPGDLLVVEGNGSKDEVGRCALWSGEISDCVHQNHIIRCRPVLEELSQFVLLFLNSPAGIVEMQRLAVTTSGLYNLSVGKIRQISFPLPPLEEQRRIVTKVRHLMSLCDELEAKLGRRETTTAALSSSTVQALSA